MAELRWRLIYFPHGDLHLDNVFTGKINREMMRVLQYLLFLVKSAYKVEC